MSNREEAEQFKRDLLKHGPSYLEEEYVEVSSSPEEMSGEMRTYVKVKIEIIPAVELDDKERRLPEDEQEQVLEDKREFKEEVRKRRTSIIRTIEHLAKDSYRLHGTGKFEPTSQPYKYNYYTVEIK